MKVINIFQIMFYIYNSELNSVYFEKKITKFFSWVSSWWRVIIDWDMPET